MALQNGVDVKTVSSMLGHYSAGFTLDTYAHVTTDAQLKAAQTMGSILSRAVRYPLPLGSAFGSEKSSRRKQQLMQTKRPETLRFRVFLARREGFEPPAFWSVARRSIQLS